MKKGGKCPQCGCTEIKIILDNSLEFIQCSKCGYDELEADEALPETRTSQKEKGRYSPYKTGGRRRSRK